MFWRLSSELCDTKLLSGANDVPREAAGDLPEEEVNRLKDILNSDDKWEDCTFIENHIKQYIEIQEILKKFSTIAVQDDYPNWKENDFHREVSKLMLIDQGDYNTQHIFFDDNAD